MKSLVSLITGAALSLGAITDSTARPFEDKFGRVIEAALVSHTGAKSDMVKINRGGKEMDVKIEIFSAGDQKFIRDWMAKTPASIKYAFRVEAERKVAETERSTYYTEKGKSSDTFFALSVTNLTRQPVTGIRIEYKAFMKNHGDPSSYGSGFSMSSVEVKSVTDSIKIDKEMPYNRSANLDTKSLRIDSSRGGYSGSDFQDEMLGVIVRVYDPTDKLVTEWRTPNRAFEKIPWTYGDKKGRASTSRVEIK